MKLLVTYCTTPDGSGEDVTKECNTSNDITLYSVHNREINLINIVCNYFNIKSVQIIRIKLIS